MVYFMEATIVSNSGDSPQKSFASYVITEMDGPTLVSGLQRPCARC